MEATVSKFLFVSCVALFGAAAHAAPPAEEECKRLTPEPVAGPFCPAKIGAAALTACSRAAAEVPANPEMIYRYGRALDAAKQLEQAIVQYKKAADMGYAPGMHFFGVALLAPAGVPADRVPDSRKVEGLRWVEKAASQSYAPAVFRVGLWYWKGYAGLPKDRAKAEAKLELARSLGQVRAIGVIGQMAQEDGDHAKAKLLLTQAASQGDVTALAVLAKQLADGNGVPKNVGQAEALFRKAIDKWDECQSNPYDFALIQLSDLQRKRGEPRTAIATLERGLLSNTDPASRASITSAIASTYERFLYDYERALAHWRRALEDDPTEPYAHWAMGRFYENGWANLVEDPVAARSWYLKAKGGNDPNAAKSASEAIEKLDAFEAKARVAPGKDVNLTLTKFGENRGRMAFRVADRPAEIAVVVGVQGGVRLDWVAVVPYQRYRELDSGIYIGEAGRRGFLQKLDSVSVPGSLERDIRTYQKRLVLQPGLYYVLGERMNSGSPQDRIQLVEVDMRASLAR